MPVLPVLVSQAQDLPFLVLLAFLGGDAELRAQTVISLSLSLVMRIRNMILVIFHPRAPGRERD